MTASQISSGLQRNTFDKPQEDCAMQKEGKQACVLFSLQACVLGVTDRHVNLLSYNRSGSCYNTLPETVKYISLYPNIKVDQEKAGNSCSNGTECHRR